MGSRSSDPGLKQPKGGNAKCLRNCTRRETMPRTFLVLQIVKRKESLESDAVRSWSVCAKCRWEIKTRTIPET